MRSDALGIFWRDEAIVKAAKAEKPKRTPPEATWLAPDYLPGLEEAKAFKVQLFTDTELVDASYSWMRGEGRTKLVFDIECYANYFLAAFRCVKTKRVTYVEMSKLGELDIAKFKWILENFLIVTFNGISYDLPIAALALANCSTQELKHATNQLILEEKRGSDILKSHKVKKLQIDHIDLIEVAPLHASLKIYGGRLHVPRMQDLPFHPEAILSDEQKLIVRWYCINDLVATELLDAELTKQQDLRSIMSNEYGVDLRSKSDAQIAETVISQEVENINGVRANKPQILIGTKYRYTVPHFIKFSSPLMNWALNIIRQADFIVAENGAVGMPEQLSELNLTIANGVYRMGIGGLHSSESSQAVLADENYFLKDVDVVSYYPKIILNQGLYPAHLGTAFLKVYQRLVDRRISAKRAGNKSDAESLKITINGSFGKLGSKYSVLYAPDLLIQTTVTGQLSLLMLIERLEILGINVVSANTDGIVIKCLRSREDELTAVIKQWEADTNFETEEQQYAALYSRDVNNYIALKLGYDKENKRWLNTLDGYKVKGAYNTLADMRLHKNPANEICVEAVIKFLIDRTPVSATIRSCKDITKFVSVRTVKGGAVKNGVYLGKAVRWYLGTGEAADGEMVYARNGNKVPKSDGGVPCMDIPAMFPDNIDYEQYESECETILKNIGYYVE